MKLTKRFKSTRTKSSRPLMGSILALFIAGIPYCMYWYIFIPEVAIWEPHFIIPSFQIGNFYSPTVYFTFTFEDRFWLSAHTFAWMIAGQTSETLVYIIAAYAARKWVLSFAFLSGVAVQIFRFYGIIEDSQAYVDEWDMIHTIPTFIIICILIIILKLYYQHRLVTVNAYRELMILRKKLMSTRNIESEDEK